MLLTPLLVFRLEALTFFEMKGEKIIEEEKSRHEQAEFTDPAES